MFEIIRYTPDYEDELMELIRQEANDWKEYWAEPNASVYRKTFEASITYLALSDGKVCGYSRSLLDGLYIYVCDLLVNKAYRGSGLGDRLMRILQEDYPGKPVYIMSDSDGYYEKLGYSREGSMYLMK